MALDLTPFDFTPTESLVYGVLVSRGPGTGYAIARAAGLARANAYAALAGLVAKGAARVEEGRPRRYRPEPPSVLLARIVDRQSHAIDVLSRGLQEISIPPSPTLTPVTSLRGVTQLLSLEAARALIRVRLLLPGEVYPGLAPALRRAGATEAVLELLTDGGGAEAVPGLEVVETNGRWPGRPLLAVFDDRLALIGSQVEGEAAGYWTTAPALVAAADHTMTALRARR